MVTFIGTPNMLVVLNPPIGNIKRLRFDAKGEITTENEKVIKRFHHKFDSKPAENEVEQVVEELDDGSADVAEKVEEVEEVKQYSCKKCEFTTENKGSLMAHHRAEHPKEEDHE